MAAEMKTERITTMMTPSEVKALDDWAFANRIRSRGEAIRRLIEAGLKASHGTPSGTSSKTDAPAKAKPVSPARNAPRAKPAAMSKEAQIRALRERSG